MRRILTATLLAAALYAADPAREQTLQRAIDLMESKGDLAKAMPLFEEAARSADKALAARALLYLGQGQERHGAEKARATYERIVREFGSQTETVAVARKRLAALGTGAAPQTLTKRLICDVCGDVEADFSPDRRMMVQTDWDTGDLVIRDTNTGQSRRLMAKTGSFKESRAYAESPVFSPDLRQVVYHWEACESDCERVQLRIVGTEPGSKIRVLVDSPEIGYYEPLSWSRDGKAILVLLSRSDRTWQLAWVSAADGVLKVVKSLEWRLRNPRMGQPSLSPDGRYITYSALAVNPRRFDGPLTSTDRWIYVIASDGSSETELVKTAGRNESPVWTPDGRHLLFTSDRAGGTSLWSLPIENGKAAGSPTLVMAGTGPIHPSMMVHNSYYYTVPQATRIESVGIAEIGRSAKPTEGFVGIRPEWSPDGKKLAFLRHSASGGENSFDIVVHTLETGEETVYSFNGIRAWARWFHDGKSLFVLAIQDQGRNRGIYRVDLQTKEFKLLLPFDPAELAVPIGWVSPDDRTFYTAGREPGKNNIYNRILAVDLSTGQQRQVVSFPGVGQLAIKLSPDGRTLAIRRRYPNVDEVVISTVAVDGSNFRDVHTAAVAESRADLLGWAADSRGILFANRIQDNWQILRIPAEGGKPEPTGFEGTGALQNMSFSPDGKRFAFSAPKRTNEMWAIDNILSVLK